MKISPFLPRTLQTLSAVALLAALAACGGGGSDGDPSASLKPKPNPITVAPTTNCSADGIAASNASTATATVCVLTSSGEIVIALDTVKAPITTANFLQYVASGYYNNTIFHRVVPGFVVQGGGYVSGYTVKPGQVAPIALESQNGLSNVRGSIAMARTSVPNSATSEFYFNTVDNPKLDYDTAVGSPNGFAVFGRVISGTATIDKINAEVQLYVGAEATATEVLLYWAKRLK